jgi:hypothetical protein
VSAETEWPARACKLYGHRYQGKSPCFVCGADYVELTAVEQRIAAAVKWDLHDEAGRDQHAEDVGRKIAKSLKAAGYAVVELPKPMKDRSNVADVLRSLPMWSSADAWTCLREPNLIEFEANGQQSYGELNNASARSLAAALLAAAEFDHA